MKQRTAESDLATFIKRYEKTKRAISVNFRDLVAWIPVGERATHYIHPYPGKLLPHIPAFFLASEVLSKPGDVVLDPFCGSGTVLLESVLHGRNGLGADSNPLARLISNVKVTDCRVERLRTATDAVVRSARRRRRADAPAHDSLHYWFYPHVIEQLAKLKAAIDSIDEQYVRDFLKVCLSVCARRASLADPRVAVPVRLHRNPYPKGHPFHDSSDAHFKKLRRQDVFAAFSRLSEANIERIEAFRSMRFGQAHGAVTGSDARKLTLRDGRAKIPTGTVDMIITSPPYPGAQQYIRASSLSLIWLDLLCGNSLSDLEQENIGRGRVRQKNWGGLRPSGIGAVDKVLQRIAEVDSSRAALAATYIEEMSHSLAESARVLKRGGYFVLVGSNNTISGCEFNTRQYFGEILRKFGLKPQTLLVDDIKSRALMTRRNKTADVIRREWIYLFEKG